ncbi:oocyte zinc finger protein XlCOF7.1-like [Pseudophryne corroboree]|uniref:oocyte zinc finger protein XlCOF7.1-like n=1 Tax=Pseudophryne corroboree TaxID=495146 RepID=UPI003081D446
MYSTTARGIPAGTHNQEVRWNEQPGSQVERTTKKSGGSNCQEFSQSYLLFFPKRVRSGSARNAVAGQLLSVGTAVTVFNFNAVRLGVGESCLQGTDSYSDHSTDPLRMGKDRSQMTEKILNLTLEIIYLLIGEQYTVARKTSGETPSSHPSVSGGLSRTQSPIPVPPPHSLTHERHNDQKILELTNKIIQLLTGEVPIRCEDVTVYFSMEEWEYIEEHRGLYKDVMMENHRTLTSPGIHRGGEDVWKECDTQEPLLCVGGTEQSLGVSPTGGISDTSTPERCSSPLCSLDRAEESHSVLQEDQNENQIDIKIEVIEHEEEEEEEEMYVRGDQQCKEEEIPTDISAAETNEDKASTVMSPGRPQGFCQYQPSEKSSGINHQSPPQASTYQPTLQPVPCLQYHGPGSIFSHPDGQTSRNISQGHLIPSPDHIEDNDIRRIPQCENAITTNIHPVHRRADLSSGPSTCGRYFPGNSDFTRITSHSGDQMFAYANYNQRFTLPTNLITQQRRHALQTQFPCYECGKCFPNPPSLAEHWKTHTGAQQYLCSECGKWFVSKSDFAAHQRMHAYERPFFCSECGKCFTQKAELVRHRRYHTGEKLFSCYECGKCFIKKSDFARHQRYHTGEKPFSCCECGKCFSQKADFVRHQRIHTGEKPFPCSECGKCFTLKANLLLHLRIHTGEKPYSCAECGKCFAQKSYLVIHQKTHTGEKPYSCSGCGKCFTQKSSLARHDRIYKHSQKL